MKEVALKRYAGPYDKLPFEYYVQSPIGLIPKSGGKTRLIFHLSYDFGPEEKDKSINHHTPSELCSVKYYDLDHAIRMCLRLLANCKSNTVIFFGKTDCSSAFRIVPISPKQRQYMVLMAKHPTTGIHYFFIDKCLPFGSSRSCRIFQEFSDALRAIAEYRMIAVAIFSPALTNYLDDFLFMALCWQICKRMMVLFIDMCKHLGCPIAAEKTE